MSNWQVVYTIDDAIAELLCVGLPEYSATTIRCTLNDLLDRADKEGCAVEFDYNQRDAIREVREQAAEQFLKGNDSNP